MSSCQQGFLFSCRSKSSRYQALLLSRILVDFVQLRHDNDLSVVFKVYSIDGEKLTELHNLRSKTGGLNYSASDVVWSPHDDNVFVSASSRGSVVFWDLNITARNKMGNSLLLYVVDYRLSTIMSMF